MNQSHKLFRGGVLALTISFAGLSGAETSESPVLFSDDFESYDKTGEFIGGGWKWQKFGFSNADCSEGFSAYPDFNGGPPDGGGPRDAQNFNYFTTDPYYTNQGLADGDNAITGTLSLSQVQDQYAVDNGFACTISRTLQTKVYNGLTLDDVTLESGNFKITAKAKLNAFGPNPLPDGAAVGVFLTIQDIDNEYSEIINSYRDVSLSGSVTDVIEDFEVDFGEATNVVVTTGIYTRHKTTGAGAVWDDWEVSLGGLTEEEKAALAAENAACQDTSTIRFEEEFGDVDATCLTDTYSFPADAEDWGGYADKIKDESLYPFGHFYGGGTITLDCEKVGTGSQRVKFKFEVEGFPGNTNGPETDWATCTAPATSGLGRLSEVVATQDAGSITLQIPASPRGESYNNLIMYLETKGGADVKVTNVAITAARRSDPDSGAATGQPSPGMPIPVLPFWALLALVTATGLIAVRKR